MLFLASAANAKTPPEACQAWKKIIPLLDPKEASIEEQNIGWLNVADACARGRHRSRPDLLVAKQAMIQLAKIDKQGQTMLRNFQAKHPSL